MRHSQAPCPVLTVICLLFPVLNAQGIHVKPEVWGYVGQEEVVLPCQFNPGPNNGNVNQVQWDLIKSNAKEGEKPITLVVHVVSDGGTKIDEMYLDKVVLKDYSLVIKNVDLDDAGVYTCQLATFPAGSFSDKTTLFITDQMPLSAGVVSAIVISVLLLLGIIAAAAYFIVIRRCPPSSRNNVTIDTDGWDPTRPSFIKTEDVIYSDVTAIPQPPNQNHVNSSEDHVTYSEVRVNRMTPDEDTDDMNI